jgi:hypothetical protein
MGIIANTRQDKNKKEKREKGIVKIKIKKM